MANKKKKKPNKPGTRNSKSAATQPPQAASEAESKEPSGNAKVSAPNPHSYASKRATARAAKVRKQRRDRVLVAAVIALVVGGIIAIAVVTRSNDTGITDSAVWDLPALEGDLDEDGLTDRFLLADYAGTPLVVNFFASWCVSCENELPRFVHAANSLEGDLEIVYVNSNETGNWKPMAERTGIRNETLIKDIKGSNGNGLYRSLGGTGGMPLTAFYDAAGNLVNVDRGELSTQALAIRLQEFFGLTY